MNTQTSSALPEIRSYDLQIEVWANGTPIQVEGMIEIWNPGLSPLQSLTLYLHPELSVITVASRDGLPLDYETKAVAHDWSYTKSFAAHSIELAEPIAAGDTQLLHLSYQGSFSPSSLRSPSDFMRIDRKGAYLRGLGYSLWFPVTVRDGIDSSADFHIQLDVPSEWTGVAFGNLERAEHSGKRSISWWSTQSPFKLVQAQLFASPFEIHEGKYLSVFASQGNSRSAHKLINFGDRLLEFFAGNYGSTDGISRYFVVETCPYGCIASGNVIGLSPDVFQRIGISDIDFETYDLIAHELVHGFVTPLIDRTAPGAALLLEGFPSYFHVPAVTDVLGDNYCKWFFRRAWISYRDGVEQQMGSSRDPSIPIDKPLLDIEIGEIPYYKDRFLLSDKFPVLLDRLRMHIDSDIFFTACGEFFTYAATHHVAIADFFHTLEVHSKRNLSEFYGRWFSSSEPLPDCWEQSGISDANLV